MSTPLPTNGISTPRKGFWLINYVRTHPLLLLLLLSPGIPEYLSGSSNWAVLVENPLSFFFLLALNIGLYFTGVVIIREAKIRWRKGWASVFLLGFAYAIVEEGLALRTLYNPLSPPVGTLGSYGHWAGVNWVWTVGLLLFHSAYSIALPIFIFGLAFPTLKSKSLVSRRGLGACLSALVLDSIVLSTVVKYDPGPSILLFSSLVILIFAMAARSVPADLVRISEGPPTRGPKTLGFLGALFFPSTLLLGGISQGLGLPPFIPMALDVMVSLLLFFAIVQGLGSQKSQAHKTALAIGLLLPIVCFGLVASIGFPLVLGEDVAVLLFSRRLWRRYKVQLPTSSLGLPLHPLGGLPGTSS